MASLIKTDGNLLCVVDLETTSLDLKVAEIIEICILPLDSFLEVSRKIQPFHLRVRPDYPDLIDHDALVINKSKLPDLLKRGVSQDELCDLLNKWFDNIRLPEKKRIMPVGHNIAGYDRPVLIKTLGQPNYDLIFHHHIRDTLIAGLFINDRLQTQYEEAPFKFLTLESIANKLGVARGDSHTALDDCLTCLEIYKRMLGTVLGLQKD